MFAADLGGRNWMVRSISLPNRWVVLERGALWNADSICEVLRELQLYLVFRVWRWASEVVKTCRLVQVKIFHLSNPELRRRMSTELLLSMGSPRTVSNSEKTK